MNKVTYLASDENKQPSYMDDTTPENDVEALVRILSYLQDEFERLNRSDLHSVVQLIIKDLSRP